MAELLMAGPGSSWSFVTQQGPGTAQVLSTQ